jgi:hypothetical protein
MMALAVRVLGSARMSRTAESFAIDSKVADAAASGVEKPLQTTSAEMSDASTLTSMVSVLSVAQLASCPSELPPPGATSVYAVFVAGVEESGALVSTTFVDESYAAILLSSAPIRIRKPRRTPSMLGAFADRVISDGLDAP